MSNPLKLACIGCGSRAQTYTSLAAKQPERFEVVAGADPVAARVEKVRQISGRADFRGFASAEELLAAGKIADVMIVATQDNDHYRHCTGALRAGYNVLLEKPISTRAEQALEIEQLARQANRRVMVCFVLRFAAFYRKVKEIIQSGALGEITGIQANEGVMPWHHAHSFVRGHWSVVAKSSPMIISKCCHDTDIVHWLVGRRCRAQDTSTDEIVAWLQTSPWGRCVYRCDNDAVDRQVLAMEFDGGVTGTFTMTAFENGRHIEVYGTRGVPKGGETYHKHFGAHLVFFPHEGEPVRYTVQAEDGGYELHGGGDPGLVRALYDEMTQPAGAPLEAVLNSTVHSHLIGFAAEEARVTGRTIGIEEFQRSHAKGA